MGPQLLVVIVNYRTAGLAIDCLRSIAGRAGSSPRLRVVVVDNASGDGSVGKLRAAIDADGWSGWVELIASDRNGGFAAGNNLAISREMSRAPADRVPYVLLLNPDTVIHPDAISTLVDFMEQHPRAGIAGSRIEDGKGRVAGSARRFPSPLGELEAAARCGPVTRLLRRHTIPMAESASPMVCDWVSGAAMILRTEMLEAVGLFDDGYFLYYEETDLCRRAVSGGWQVWFVPGSRVVHHEGSSTGIRNWNRRRPRYWYESRRRYFVNAFGAWGWVLTDVCWAAGRLIWTAQKLSGWAACRDQDPRGFAADLIGGDWAALRSGRWRDLLSSPRRGRAAGPEAGTVGLVVIGRNEGERLRRCLSSCRAAGLRVVYVDSASTDGSAALARSMGCDVVDLDVTRPFTAARARNEGFEELLRRQPDVGFVQFVDGDCELAPAWCDRARREFRDRPDAGVVCGRLREREPEASIYNRLCDMEWDEPVGEAAACGGIAMMRVAAFRQAGGFDPSVVAGEEPELCLRMRRAGWNVFRIADEMGFHDAAITQWGQWWTRNVRAGHAYAQSTSLHGASPDRAGVRENVALAFWAWAVPAAALSAAWPTRGISLFLFLLYPLLTAKIAVGRRRRGATMGQSWLYAAFCVLAKWPQALGQLRFVLARRAGHAPVLIEYKGVAAAPKEVGKGTGGGA
jgi:GT2 family glycosyltransferase